jgi:hypothetical protein
VHLYFVLVTKAAAEMNEMQLQLARLLFTAYPMQATPDIAILWKRPDGTSCVLSRRGNTLVVSLQMFGNVQKEQAVESPQEAMEVAKSWQATERVLEPNR